VARSLGLAPATSNAEAIAHEISGRLRQSKSREPNDALVAPLTLAAEFVLTLMQQALRAPQGQRSTRGPRRRRYS
jgi:hypothetical protein